MSGRQDQKVAEGGLAIQSQRDTNIHQGISTDEMRIIVNTLTDQLPKLAAIAKEIVDERLKAFEEKIIERFERDAAAKREAFADPDFQQSVLEAQRGYARTANEQSQETLIELIVQKSKEKSGTRLSYTLTESISISAKLTSAEFCELAFVFANRMVKYQYLSTIQEFVNVFSVICDEFLSGIESSSAPYQYLVAQRCATISMGKYGLIDVWKKTYPGLFMKGLPEEEFAKIVGKENLNNRLFCTSVFDNSGVQINALDRDVFNREAQVARITDEISAQLWARAEQAVATDEEIMARLDPSFPKLKDAVAVWHSTPLKSLELTAVGIAIAHTTASRLTNLRLPNLEIWLA